MADFVLVVKGYVAVVVLRVNTAAMDPMIAMRWHVPEPDSRRYHSCPGTGHTTVNLLFWMTLTHCWILRCTRDLEGVRTRRHV
jgi:hypothetical protein